MTPDLIVSLEVDNPFQRDQDLEKGCGIEPAHIYRMTGVVDQVSTLNQVDDARSLRVHVKPAGVDHNFVAGRKRPP